MNKEAEKLLKSIKVVPATDDAEGVTCCKMRVSDYVKIDQALAILKEQPNCEGCEFFKHTHSNEHCWRYTEARSLCKLRQEPIEQPPASGMTKKFNDLIEEIKSMFTVSQAMARNSFDSTQPIKDKADNPDPEPSHKYPEQSPAGGFTKELRRKLSDSCCAIIEDLPGWRSMVAEARVMSFEACTRLDRSEASREELLTACRVGLSYINALICKVPRPILELREDKELVEVALAKEKEGGE